MASCPTSTNLTIPRDGNDLLKMIQTNPKSALEDSNEKTSATSSAAPIPSRARNEEILAGSPIDYGARFAASDPTLQHPFNGPNSIATSLASSGGDRLLSEMQEASISNNIPQPRISESTPLNVPPRRGGTGRVGAPPGFSQGSGRAIVSSKYKDELASEDETSREEKRDHLSALLSKLKLDPEPHNLSAYRDRRAFSLGAGDQAHLNLFSKPINIRNREPSTTDIQNFSPSNQELIQRFNRPNGSLPKSTLPDVFATNGQGVLNGDFEGKEHSSPTKSSGASGDSTSPPRDTNRNTRDRSESKSGDDDVFLTPGEERRRAPRLNFDHQHLTGRPIARPPQIWAQPAHHAMSTSSLFPQTPTPTPISPFDYHQPRREVFSYWPSSTGSIFDSPRSPWTPPSLPIPRANYLPTTPPPADPYPSSIDGVERQVIMHRNAASYSEARCTWSGQLPVKTYKNPMYSTKVFLGGVPWDITEQGLIDAFKQFGNVHVQWPTGAQRSSFGFPSQQTAGKAGYVYIIFDSEKSVKALLAACTHDFSMGGKYYYNLSSKKIRGKEVQVIPWVLSDANYVKCPSQRLDPTKTVFVGALHGMLTAEGLAQIMNDLFGGVVYVGIDTDRHKYPIGSARVTFSNHNSYSRAVKAAFVEIKSSRFNKKIQIDPYLENSICTSCQMQPGPIFCRDQCFRYFCKACWNWQHSVDTMKNHRPIMKNRRDS